MRRRSLHTSCSALVLASSAFVASAALAAQEGATVKRLLPAVRLQPAPVIDGDLSDACWQGAARAERFVPDRRPFFLEGASIYGNSGEAWRHYYSPRIRDFDLGVNLYGKVSPRETLGVLAAWDVGRRLDSVLRASHAFGPSSRAGLMLVSRDDRQEANRVLVGTGGVRRGFWSISGAWGGSWAEGRHLGSTGETHFAYQTPRWYAEVAPHFITPRFRDDLGLVPFTGFRGVNSYLDYSTEWRSGPLRSLFVTSGVFDSDRYDGSIFRRERRLIAGVTTRGDHSFRAGWEGGRREGFRDSVFGVDWRVRVSDPFHNFGVGVSWGRRAGAPILFVTPAITWRFGAATTLGLSSAILRHASDAEQHILTFNYDFSPERGIVGRLVAQTGGTNAYLAYRRSGYGGVETFLILGDPNALRFRQRVALKVVWAK